MAISVCNVSDVGDSSASTEASELTVPLAPSAPFGAFPIASLFDALVESSSDAILTKTPGGIVASWNPAASRLYGYSSAEAVGKPISMLIPQDRAGEAREILDRILSGERVDHYETERVRKDGRKISVSLTVSPVHGPGGEVVGASVIARDISERRRADARAGRLRRVAAALSESLAPERVVEVVLEQALPIVGADAAGFALVTDARDALELIASRGYAAQGIEPWKRMSLDRSLPLTDSVRSAEAIWSESLESLVDDYPDLADAGIPFASLAAIPLVVEGETIGAISLSYRTAHDFTADERTFLLSVAHEAAQALARGRLYDRERRARSEAETAREQLDFLSRASELLADSLDPNATLQQLGELAVPRIADWCAIDLAGETGIENVVVAHVDPAKVDLALEFRRRYPTDPKSSTGLPNVLRTGRSEIYPEIPDELLVAAAQDDEHLEMIRALRLHAVMIVPLRARGRTVGAITFVSAESGRRYEQRDLTFAEDLARRAALAIDNARLYRHEQDVAQALQRSLLPESLPELPGLEFAARYVSGTAGVEVGGDWYDVIPLGDGRVALVIGDVAGRGIPAASAMGQLRIALRAYALEDPSPANVVARVNKLAGTLPNGDMATLIYLVFDPNTGTAELVRAGHPPALVRRADGSTEYASASPGQPIGVLPRPRYETGSASLAAGSALLLYTDGLVERRGEPLDEGLTRLSHAFSTGPPGAEELCDHLIEALLSDQERPDDVAMLLLGVSGSPERVALTLPAEKASVPAARHAVVRLLDRAGAGPTDRQAVAVALSEATANVVEHAYGPRPAAFELNADLKGGVVRISVRDFGRWRRPRGEHRGRGTALMEACMDVVERKVTAEGTVVKMERTLAREAAA